MVRVPGLRAYRLLKGGEPVVGQPPAASGALRPVWLHATEPAESAVLRVLATQIAELNPDLPCLVTGGDGQPGPGESRAAIATFLDRVDPALIVLSGTVLPPNLIDAARSRGTGLFLVNARSPSPPGRWGLWPGFTRALLSGFTQIHARDAAAATALRRMLGSAVAVFVGGTLSRFPPAPGCNHFELEALRDTLSGRPAWFAYSLPQAEFDVALAAHTQALRRSHRLLLIAAPRDPRDGSVLAEQAAAAGFSCARRTLDDEITETTQVYVADAEDEPGLFLRLAPVSYLGGSLSRETETPGPLPAAALGSALVYGPHSQPGDRAFLEQLRRAGGGRRISLPAELGEAVSALLAPEIGAEAALRAWSLATEGSDATWQLAQAICDWVALNKGQAA